MVTPGMGGFGGELYGPPPGAGGSGSSVGPSFSGSGSGYQGASYYGYGYMPPHAYSSYGSGSV
jgi:hypothetical protein